jgi:hypothetical protein
MESDEFRIAQFEKYLRRLEEKESKRKSQPVDSENYNSEEDDTGSQHRHASSSGRGSDKNRNDRVEEELRSKRHRSHREESVHSDQDRGRSRRHVSLFCNGELIFRYLSHRKLLITIEMTIENRQQQKIGDRSTVLLLTCLCENHLLRLTHVRQSVKVLITTTL